MTIRICPGSGLPWGSIASRDAISAQCSNFSRSARDPVPFKTKPSEAFAEDVRIVEEGRFLYSWQSLIERRKTRFEEESLRLRDEMGFRISEDTNEVA